VECMKELHKNNMVHGDIREPNVLMKGEESVYLIDFEFSGEVGQARYSKHLNSLIDWHRDV
jgi:tRNA A-37 threonylcarbamoyl transferase component Bud32